MALNGCPVHSERNKFMDYVGCHPSQVCFWRSKSIPSMDIEITQHNDIIYFMVGYNCIVYLRHIMENFIKGNLIKCERQCKWLWWNNWRPD